MRKIYISILSVFSFLLSLGAQPNHLSFYTISANEGLPFENSYYSIVQDYEGFIWFASDNGLHKYNGYEFISYYNNQEDSTSIRGRSIRCLLEDSNKNLWIGCIGGLNIYNRIEDNFIQVPILRNGQLIFNFDARSIIEAPDNQIYVGLSEFGIGKYNPEKNYVEIINFNIPELPENFINDINTLYIDDDDNLWYSTDNYGLFRIDRKLAIVIHFAMGSEYYLSSNVTYSFIQDSKGYIWVATDNGLNRINTSNLTSKVYYTNPSDKNSISFNIIWRIYEDSRKNLWVCTDGGGLDLYDRENDNFLHFKHDKEAVNSLAGNKINGIFLDNQDNLYVNTVGYGFSIANLKESDFFKVHIHGSDSKLTLGYDIINAFAEDNKGNIWIGTDGGGLDHFNIQKDRFNHFTANADDPKKLQTNTIVSLYYDKNDVLWVGTYKGGLSRYNKENNSFTTYLHEPGNKYSLSNNDIRGIIEDKKGDLLLATCGGGICLMDKNAGKFTSYQTDNNNTNSLCNNYCQTIYKDSEGNIWIGTYYGLSKWNRENNRFTTFLHDPEDSTTINDYIIYAVYEDKNNNLWVGTISGLNLYNKENQSFRLIENSNYAVFGIQEDSDGNLWLSTEKGLKKYNCNTGKIMSFNSRYGFQGQSFRPGANLKSRNGQMIFGGNKGFIMFHPDSLKKSNFIPPVYITDVLISSALIHDLVSLKNNFCKTNKIILRHNQSFITIKYTALDFYNSNQVNYSYLLKNFDNDWHEVDKQRIATYSNLDPGDYLFKVKAKDGNNNWINETSLNIKILPPWWETPAARIFFILSLLLIVGTAHYLKFSTLKNQKKVLDRLVQKRTREIEIINHELRISNNTKDKLFSIIAHDLKNPFSNVLGFSQLLSSRYYKLSEEKKLLQIKLLHESAEKIYHLLENLLDWSRSQSGRLKYQPEPLLLSEVVGNNIELFQSLIKEKNLDTDVEIPEKTIVYADKNMITTVIRNLLSNAVKFSNKGKIYIYAESIPGKIILKIKDEGIGISKDRLDNIFDIKSKISSTGTNGESGSGLGLIICKEFVERNNGSISVKSKINEGSIFTVTIPAYDVN